LSLDDEKPLAPGEVRSVPPLFAWAGVGLAVLVTIFVASMLGDGAPNPARNAPGPPVAHAPDFVPIEGTFAIRDASGLHAVEASGRWRIAEGRLEVVADETTIRNRRNDCANCPALSKWQYVLRTNSYGVLLSPSGRYGFEPQPLPQGDELRMTGHRMVVPLQQRKDIWDDPKQQAPPFPAAPGVLEEFWIGIDLFYEGDWPTSVNMTEPYAIADALTKRDLAPARCARARGVAEIVERGCHDRLAFLLGNPIGRQQIDQGGGLAVRGYPMGTTPLELAVLMDDIRAAKLLLDHGALAGGVDPRGYTPLMRAAAVGSPKMVALLLKYASRLDATFEKHVSEDTGRSALMMAAASGRAENVRLLLQAGANRRLEARDGRNALAIARDAGHAEVVALLS